MRERQRQGSSGAATERNCRGRDHRVTATCVSTSDARHASLFFDGHGGWKRRAATVIRCDVQSCGGALRVDGKNHAVGVGYLAADTLALGGYNRPTSLGRLLLLSLR